MKKENGSYKEIREFIEANYTREKEKIDEIDINDFNDYMVDDVLGNKTFENEVDEFLYTLSMCLIMKKMNLEDKYFFDSLKELTIYYKDGNYDEYLLDKNEKELIDKDLTIIF